MDDCIVRRIDDGGRKENGSGWEAAGLIDN